MIHSLKICGITCLMLLNALLSVGQVIKSENESHESIINNTDWFDVAGRPIMAHEGDIARFNGYFYWYGSSYENNPTGKFDIADGPVWNGVQVYRSTDLKNWTYKTRKTSINRDIYFFRFKWMKKRISQR